MESSVVALYQRQSALSSAEDARKARGVAELAAVQEIDVQLDAVRVVQEVQNEMVKINGPKLE